MAFFQDVEPWLVSDDNICKMLK
jgi:hypothetical protein